MPALATRHTGPGPERPREPSSLAGARELVSERLSGEFATVRTETVERCVEDVWACAAHLGLEVSAPAVERIAREHLRALAASAPLAGREGDILRTVR
ncbi:hypothetical protein Skr01_50990 [Sphaerisporangium krabiense]|uniref:Uncharacterized protein n=1 Tax=Sphaerisporangium krabiense TaxID=763782 RepID=A0A7W9DST4_9ACTN|nr:hypothetical protein [Sphaerisporangium krabiense]MBB5630067.1 hypothetical protein [Sphaerisporangium krabiense]GII65014.1 hypothetical protein Skr01_50990 [Sphaerisporangium krabiense]